MRVSELIEKLSAMPGDARVAVNGELGYEFVQEIRYFERSAAMADGPAHIVLLEPGWDPVADATTTPFEMG